MVAARKNKARLDKSTLTRLKKKNAASQAKEMELTPEALGRVGDELVNATIQGFNDELASSPAPIKALAKQFSGLIEEFFKGFKEGVNAEISEFVKNNRKISETTIEDIEKVTTTNIKALTETVTDVVEEKTAPPALTKEKTDKAVSSILERGKGKPETILEKKTGFKDFMTRVGMGVIGQEAAAEDIISERKEKQAFVETETKLRSEEFKGMSSEDVKKKLEEDYKTIQTTTQELKKIEEQISTYKEMGYSPEQMTKLGVDDKKKELVQKAIKADPSRMSEYTKYIEGDTTTNNRQPTTTISNSDTGTRITNFGDNTKSTSTSVLEETAMEQAALQQDSTEEQEKQTTLLSEIRELLKRQPAGAAGGKEAAPAASQPAGEDGGGGFDVGDLLGKGKTAAGGARGAKAGGIGKTLKGMVPKGAVKSVAGTAAAGAVMLGVTNAVDTGLGKLGVGNDAEGNLLKIDEAQDEENWNKATFGEKIGSGVARGIEKVGGFLGWDNIVTQARADRIKTETEYLKKKHATVEDTKKSVEETVDINFNEQEFSQRDPDTYKKFVQFRNDRIQQIAIDQSKKFDRKEPTPADMQVARSIGNKEAIEKFKKEIEAAGVGNVKGGAQTPQKTAAEQTTPTEEKQQAQIDKTVSGATPPAEVPAASSPAATPAIEAVPFEPRKLEDITKPIGTATVAVPFQPARNLVKTSGGTFAPGALLDLPAAPAAGDTIDASFNQDIFAANDPENYKKFVTELETKTESLTQEYLNSGRFGEDKDSKEMARQEAETSAKKETILKFQKEIEAAGAGAAGPMMGIISEKPGPFGEAMTPPAVPELGLNQPPSVDQALPGAPNTPPAPPAAPGKGGFFSNLLNNVKNFFGMGTPTVEQKIPSDIISTVPTEGPMALEKFGSPLSTDAAMWQPSEAAPTQGIDTAAIREQAKKMGLGGDSSKEFFGVSMPGMPKEGSAAGPQMPKIGGGLQALEQAMINSETAPPKQMSPSLQQAPVDATAMNAAAEVGKNITIQSPPPVVVPTGGGGGGQTMMSQPFTSNVRNAEPTLNKYLASRYLNA